VWHLNEVVAIAYLREYIYRITFDDGLEGAASAILKLQASSHKLQAAPGTRLLPPRPDRGRDNCLVHDQ
jgi:hypothetical protein